MWWVRLVGCWLCCFLVCFMGDLVDGGFDGVVGFGFGQFGVDGGCDDGG